MTSMKTVSSLALALLTGTLSALAASGWQTDFTAAQTAAKSVLHAKLEGVLSLTLPDIKAVVASVAAGKRAISLCSSMLSAVAKAAARR